MEYNNLYEHLYYSMFFEYKLKEEWNNFVLDECKRYSKYIQYDKFIINVNTYGVNENKVYGFVDIVPCNNYTSLMLSLNKKGIERYNKLEKINNINV